MLTSFRHRLASDATETLWRDAEVRGDQVIGYPAVNIRVSFDELFVTLAGGFYQGRTQPDTEGSYGLLV